MYVKSMSASTVWNIFDKASALGIGSTNYNVHIEHHQSPYLEAIIYV